MADRSVKNNYFRLDWVNFPCMNFESTITIFLFICDFVATNLILVFPTV